MFDRLKEFLTGPPLPTQQIYGKQQFLFHNSSFNDVDPYSCGKYKFC